MSRHLTKVNEHDREAGVALQKDSRGHFIPLYDQDIALEILERIASGELLKEICALSGMPHISTVRRWMVNNPAFGRAFQSAVQISAASLEEEALGAAREVKRTAKKLSGTEVRAFEVAMAQFRWSASRRDPSKFGERAPASVIVPIQINTSLDLGARGELENIYSVDAKITVDGETVKDEVIVPDPTKKPLGRPPKPRLFKTPQASFTRMMRGETNVVSDNAGNGEADVRVATDDAADQSVEPAIERGDKVQDGAEVAGE